MAFMVSKQFKPTGSKYQKWSTISWWRGEIASSFFQVIQWLANGKIIGQCCFSHLTLKEGMTYHQFRGDKKAQKPSLQFLVLRLSSFTIVTWVELILCLDRESSVRFYLCSFFDMMDIACINSYFIYNMKHPNKLPLLDYKIVVAKSLIQYLWGQKRAVPMSRPSKRKNQPIVRKGVPTTPPF